MLILLASSSLTNCLFLNTIQTHLDNTRNELTVQALNDYERDYPYRDFVLIIYDICLKKLS